MPAVPVLQNTPPPTSRRDFLRTAALGVAALGALTSPGCGKKASPQGATPKEVTHEMLFEKLRQEPTLLHFSATLIEEQRRQDRDGKPGFNVAEIAVIREIFYTKMCEFLETRRLVVSAAEVRNDRRRANDFLNPQGILVLEGSWLRPDGTDHFDGWIASFVRREPFVFGPIILGKQQVSIGGSLPIIEVVDQLSPACTPNEIAARYLGTAIIASPTVLYSEAAVRKAALAANVPYEEERTVTLNNELGHYVFDSLIPLTRIAADTQFRLRTPSGIVIETSVDSMSELCSDYFSLSRVPSFKFERYLKQLWHSSLHNFQTARDLSYACCRRQAPSPQDYSETYTPASAKRLYFALCESPALLAAARADFMEETDNLLAAFITRVRSTYGVER